LLQLDARAPLNDSGGKLTETDTEPEAR